MPWVLYHSMQLCYFIYDFSNNNIRIYCSFLRYSWKLCNIVISLFPLSDTIGNPGGSHYTSWIIIIPITRVCIPLEY